MWLLPIAALIAVMAWLHGRRTGRRSSTAWRRGHAVGYRAGVARGEATRRELSGRLGEWEEHGRRLVDMAASIGGDER